jgi:hypothetical protein
VREVFLKTTIVLLWTNIQIHFVGREVYNESFQKQRNTIASGGKQKHQDISPQLFEAERIAELKVRNEYIRQ